MKNITINLTEYEYPLYQGMDIVRANGPLIADALTGLYGKNRIQLVCRGSSGILIAQEVQRGLPSASIHYARKEEERQHNYGMKLDTIYPIVIVDDLISTGGTLRAIRARLDEYNVEDKVEAVCLWRAYDKVTLIENTFPSCKYIIN
jgi:orotate phosphoribosyltransferase